MGERERIGAGPVIGHLTSATRLDREAVYRPEGAVALHADAEVALVLGEEGAIAGYGAALELVDLGAAPDDPEGIVATNVFHRAFALGALDRALPPDGVTGRLIVNGEVRASASPSPDLGGLVSSVAELLEAMGERLQAGDRLITGSVVQVPIGPGDRVVADLGALGRAELTIGSSG
jgi:2-keto-4-pentenoate hydratase